MGCGMSAGGPAKCARCAPARTRWRGRGPVAARLREADALHAAVGAHPDLHDDRIRARARRLHFLQLLQDLVLEQAGVPGEGAAARANRSRPPLRPTQAEAVAAGAVPSASRPSCRRAAARRWPRARARAPARARSTFFFRRRRRRRRLPRGGGGRMSRISCTTFFGAGARRRGSCAPGITAPKPTAAMPQPMSTQRQRGLAASVCSRAPHFTIRWVTRPSCVISSRPTRSSTVDDPLVLDGRIRLDDHRQVRRRRLVLPQQALELRPWSPETCRGR